MDEVLYKQFRGLPIFKSKDYIKWLRKQYPDKTIHHLTGSMTGIKLNDYLLIPLTIQEHEEAERHKIEFFNNNLSKSVKLLFEYVKELEK